jgi:membrane protease YdiL (CAAX protease family)
MAKMIAQAHLMHSIETSETEGQGKTQPTNSSAPISPVARYQSWPSRDWVIGLLYLAIIIAAELITNFVDAEGGITLYTFILVGLILHFSVDRDNSLRHFLLALCLIPLVRVVGFSLPLGGLRQIYWYPIIYTPLLAATFIVMRHLSIRPSEVGLTVKQHQIRSQLLLATSGVAIGMVEYVILKPYPLISELNPVSVILPALILIIFTGFTEELIFRGLLQRVTSGLFGSLGGIVYVSVLFAILHVGYVQGVWHRTIWDVPFVFVIALFFAWIVKRTGSLVGVTLSHSLINIGLFLVIPLLLH